ncbi:related to dehydrogenases and related proteins [Cephalotrichum gorgonifer]|uniref:Related to dehydrogenases and related proteins n=1 Tax=Cephalotrichum gorgonifer TaxID=2041049 RepID=A0AAE8MZP8_9PEZI|nr:related to dehydrogenases and related proteins [Cephalotrichum gorgonifer]
MAPIKVGIVGYGFSTKCFHLPYILPNPDLEVYAFLQRAPAPVDGSAEKPPRGTHCTVDFPLAKHYRTADEFFADAEIELVVVCTASHEEFVERALNTGKHVVVEKPFVTTSKNADELIALANEKNKVLTVFHNRRYDSDFRTLQHLISLDALGSIRDAEIHFDFRSPSWISGWTKPEYEPGEGMGFGLGTHTIDQALALFGRPRSVTAFFASNRGVVSEVDDTFTIFLGYAGNLTVTVKTAIVTHMKEQLKFFIRGTEGTYLKFGYCPQEANAIANPAQPASDPSFGKEDPAIWGDLSTTRQIDPSQTFDDASKLYVGKYPSLDGWCRGYYENVVDAIRGKAEVTVKPETARDGLKILELARESHNTGRTVITGWE